MGLLVFVAILGVAASASLSVGALAQRRAAEDELLFIGAEFQLAFQRYAEATPVGQPRYPVQLSDLLQDPRYPDTRRYLRRVYPDPLTGRDDWVAVPAAEGGIMGVHSRSKANAIKVAHFPAHFAGFQGKTRHTEWVFAYPPLAPALP
jgi:type II secretory pathway pseudopilin PulG